MKKTCYNCKKPVKAGMLLCNKCKGKTKPTSGTYIIFDKI